MEFAVGGYKITQRVEEAVGGGVEEEAVKTGAGTLIRGDIGGCGCGNVASKEDD